MLIVLNEEASGKNSIRRASARRILIVFAQEKDFGDDHFGDILSGAFLIGVTAICEFALIPCFYTSPQPAHKETFIVS
jgi:hypothetical protein